MEFEEPSRGHGWEMEKCDFGGVALESILLAECRFIIAPPLRLIIGCSRLMDMKEINLG